MANVLTSSRRASEPFPSTRHGLANRGAAEAFAAYNRHRRGRLEAQIGEKGAEALRLLPLLLHLNQPGTPGYVDDAACPVGIADYSPTNVDLGLVRRLFARSAIRRTGILRPVVDLVAVMGSAGTMGFAGDSDLDVWVCHNHSLHSTGLRLYREKVSAAETWLRKHSGLEIHLFLQSTDKIRANDFGDTDLEGCGSAMGALLKEEFYRTGVCLAGKSPYWWVVPPSVGAEGYRQQVDGLREDPSFPSDRFVDLGGLPRVPLGELFGAAVWQIVKGWKSPFKSALKMGLLEKAVCSGREASPLAEILKEKVLAGELPDPYQMLFDDVMAYYREDGDASTQDLLARCFYLKTGIRLDPHELERSVRRSDRERVLWEYVRSWGWGARKLRHLNEFGEWKYEWLQALTNEVDRFFLRTYKRIRSALDDTGEVHRITPRDLTILGRKLQAVYRRAPHKIHSLHLVSRGLEESALSLYQETLPDGEAPWRLYRGRVTPFNVDEKEPDLLRLSSDSTELLVWAAKNKILGPNTRLFCRSVEGDVSAADLEGLAHRLTSFFERMERTEPALSRLLDKPLPTRLLVIPSLGADDHRLQGIGVVYATTWGETFYRGWAGADAFRNFVQEALSPFLIQGPGSHALEVFSPPRKVGSIRGPHLRLGRHLPDLAAYLGGRDFPAEFRRRHVGRAKSGYFVLDRVSSDEIRYRTFPEWDSLLRYLSGVGPYRQVETRVERGSEDLAVLRAVCGASVPGMIDVFFLPETGVETIMVADEIGNIIHYSHTAREEPYALARLLVFLEGIMPELSAQPESPLADKSLGESVRIHKLVREGTCRALNATNEVLSRVRRLDLKPTGLTIERTVENGSQAVGYRITWGDQVIRSGEVESPLGELRRRIFEARRSGLRYDPFVTRLFLDEGFVREYCGPFVTSGHYLFYKKVIEQRLST